MKIITIDKIGRLRKRILSSESFLKYRKLRNQFGYDIYEIVKTIKKKKNNIKYTLKRTFRYSVYSFYIGIKLEGKTSYKVKYKVQEKVEKGYKGVSKLLYKIKKTITGKKSYEIKDVIKEKEITKSNIDIIISKIKERLDFVKNYEKHRKVFWLNVEITDLNDPSFKGFISSKSYYRFQDQEKDVIKDLETKIRKILLLDTGYDNYKNRIIFVENLNIILRYDNDDFNKFLSKYRRFK